MKIGFTGTRHGMTSKQQATLRELLERFAPMRFDHGDCVGADDEAATIAFTLRIPITVHPPLDVTNRAYNSCWDDEREPLTYFARNRAIVDATDILIACPFDVTHQPRGGTWYTHDYAVKKGKRVIVIWPDGTVTQVPGTGENDQSEEAPLF